ncbi:hypothetical protein EK599_02635 [Vibrio sp. T187]|uniref:hypothetical protein n=1 Tax=Vibrio TaxID=662 RepID=UPI0010C99961|nr:MULTISPECIES: hypothetical protein [Vibrio]MBW3694571.1 hypothetical protein [Vibrio sp. T187]
MNTLSFVGVCLLMFIPFASLAFDVEAKKKSEEDKQSQWRVIAIPFYDPSVDAGLSIVPIYSFYADDTSDTSSTLSATLTYTRNDSYYFKGNTDLLLNGDSIRFVSEFGYSYTNFELLNTIDTIQEDITFDGSSYFKIHDNMFLGLGLNYSSSRFNAEKRIDKALLRILGFNNEYESDTGAKLSFLWDAREHYYYPYHGFLFELSYEDHASWLGNDADAAYSSLFSDYRLFHSISQDDNHILASKWVARYLLDAENAPSSAYTTYGRQGRDVQRGFVVGDYVASHMTNLELEYRYSIKDTSSQILNNLSIVTLAGVGKVFGKQIVGPDKSFSESDTLSMVGLGLRYRLMRQERINVRMDITYNNENEVLAYFSLGENI